MTACQTERKWYHATHRSHAIQASLTAVGCNGIEVSSHKSQLTHQRRVCRGRFDDSPDGGQSLDSTRSYGRVMIHRCFLAIVSKKYCGDSGTEKSIVTHPRATRIYPVNFELIRCTGFMSSSPRS